MAITLNGTNGVTFPDSSLQAAAASPYVLKNRIINGDMGIDQRFSAGAFGTSINNYTLDRWQVLQSVTGKLNGAQNWASVTPPVGFSNYLGVASQSAYSVGSSDYYIIRQVIEGFNTYDLGFGTANAKTVTISFWVQSSLTGTFGGSLQNPAGTRSYPFSYTISTANTWEQKTITVAGDTTGAWVGSSNAGSMTLNLGLGVGSTYRGTAGAWAGSNYFAPTGATSVVGTNGATFYITGVQLEVGTSATPFERRMYGTELALCQRYYEQITSTSGTPRLELGMATAQASTTLYGIYWYKTTKRATPSATITGTNQWRTLGPNNGGSITSIGSGDISPDTWFFTATSTGYTVGQTNLVQTNDTATTSIGWSAEL